MIQIKNVQFKQKDNIILENINFTVKTSAILGIIGPNGAGKTTLLKLVSGHQRATNGFIQYDNKNIINYSPKQLAKKRAVIFQHEKFSLYFTVFHYVLLGRYCWHDGSPSHDDYQIVNEMLTLTETLPFSNRLLSTLSGGECQRVQLARALVQLIEPASLEMSHKFLLLDEHTAHLDLAYQQQSFRLLQYLAHEKKLGILVIGHDLNLIQHYADDVLVLQNGKQIAYGDTTNTLTTETLSSVFQVTIKKIILSEGRQLLFVE